MANAKGAGCGLILVAVLVIGGCSALYNAVTGNGSSSDNGSSSSGGSGGSGGSGDEHSSSSSSPKPKEGDQYGAQSVCEEFVKRRLKAPSTAKFSSEHTTHLHDVVWRVSGNVDAQNSFGAMLRDAFTCQVKYVNTTSGGDNYHLVSLTGIH